MTLKKIAKKLLDYDIVVRIEFLGTKIRAHLVEEFILDVYYNQTLGKYSYTLIKGDRRVIGWDNAPHHVKVETYPHHFHDIDGSIKPSKLSGDPLKDLDIIMDVVREVILKRSLRKK